MILVSKLFFGSAAAATLAGSMVFTDAVDAARRVGASMGWGASSQAQPTALPPSQEEQPVAPVQHSGYGSGQFPASLQYCPGRCDIGLLFSHAR